MARLNGDSADIDETESVKMLHYAIDHGVNYLDMGYPYDFSQHKRLAQTVSRALENGYRKKVRIAATLPSSFINSSREFDDYLDSQLDWLQTDRMDFYLLGGLNREVWPRLQELNVLSWAEKMMTNERIDKLGFSFHDDYQMLREILNSYDNWTLGQFQYSYMDVDHHPGIGGINYAASKGIGVTITEPLRRGRLVKKLPKPVTGLWKISSQQYSPVEWGLRWAWDSPEIATVVSDMSTIEQVKANVALAENAQADSITVQDKTVINQVREAYRKLKPVPCTACRACMPCPINIDVPRIFEIYNDAIIYDDLKTAQTIYHDERHHADICSECGSCANACAKKLGVLDWLKKAEKLLNTDNITNGTRHK